MDQVSTGVVPGTCLTCHNGTTAKGKPNGIQGQPCPVTRLGVTAPEPSANKG
jgi:hypothetical protein